MGERPGTLVTGDQSQPFLVFLSFGLWVHHMFTVGIPHLALAFFSAASMLVAVPTAVRFFAWIGTMWQGRPELKLPMLYILGFFLTFVMGGLTGVMLSVVPFNWQAHDTAFVTAHLHYVLIDGFVFPMLAGMTWWMPMMTGRRHIKGLGEAAFFVILIGFHGTFFVMHLAGLMGMPRRIPTYPDNPEWVWVNLTSSMFSFVMAIGIALFLIDIILQALLGQRSARDPWRAPGLDWALALPPRNYNFASLPGPDLQQAGTSAAMLALARGEGLLPGAPRGVREILVTTVGRAQPEHVAVLPFNTPLPFALALAICVFVLVMLAGFYAVAPLALVPVVSLIWIWARCVPGAGLRGPIEVAPNVRLPIFSEVQETLTFSGLRCLLFADGTFFASLVFGAAFLSLVSPGPSGPDWQPDAALASLIIGAALLLLGAGALFTGVALRRCQAGKAALWTLALGISSHLGALALLVTFALSQFSDPSRHAGDALRAALIAYVALHMAVGLIFSAFALHQARRGDAAIAGALQNGRLWQHYTLAIAVLSSAVVCLTGGHGMRRRRGIVWLGWVLAGPTLWAAVFATVYGLHGLGCALGWPAPPWAPSVCIAP